MGYPRTQPRIPSRPTPPNPNIPPRPAPPNPETMFEDWLDAVYPVLKETWLAGYAARYGTTSTPDTYRSPEPRQPSPVRDTLSNSAGLLWEIPDNQLPPGWRKVYHMRGEAPCRKAALILTRPLHVGETVRPEEVLRTVNGHNVSAEDVPSCGYCGLELHEPHTNQDLDWAPHLIHDTRPKTVTFADEHTPATDTYVHPIDVMDQMASNLATPLTPEELLEDVAPPIMQTEEEALRELGDRLSVYTRDMPDAAPEDTR